MAQSRRPVFYVQMGVADTVEGRFSLLTLHLVLLIDRLQAAGAFGSGLGQELFDLFIAQLDGAMREMGVGDLSMGRRMRDLGRTFYGRQHAYRLGFSALPDTDDLREALERTIPWAGLGGDPAALAIHVAARRRQLAGSTVEDIVSWGRDWPPF